MVGRVREVGCIVSINLPVVGGDVVQRAIGQAVGAAPGGRIGVYDHLAVPCDIGRCIPVTGRSIVLPAAANVNKVELALWPSPLLDV